MKYKLTTQLKTNQRQDRLLAKEDSKNVCRLCGERVRKVAAGKWERPAFLAVYWGERSRAYNALEKKRHVN